MSLMHSVLTFYGGVSEQADELKLDNQCNEMLNCIPSMSQGLQRRNPTRIIREIELLEDNKKPYIYTYDRGDRQEKYIIMVWSGLWKVFDISGNLIDEGEDDYLICNNPTEDIECVTIKDATFMVNKTITTDLFDIEEENIEKITTYKKQLYTKKIIIDHSSSNNSIYGRLQLKVVIDNSEYIKKTDDIFSDSYDETTGGSDIYHKYDATNDAINLFEQIKEEITLIDEYGLIEDTIIHEVSMEFSWIEAEGSEYNNSGYILEKDYGIITYPAAFNVNDGTSWNNTFFYWVKRTDDNYPFTYTIKNGSTIIAEETGSKSDEIATNLANTITNDESGNYSAIARGSVIKVVVANDDILTGYDTWGDQASESWQGSISSINKLPNDLKFVGEIIEISGSANNDYDNFFVRFTEKGNYLECRKPGTGFFPNPETMPHKLIRGLKHDGITPEFHFMANDGVERTDSTGNIINYKEDKWTERQVGDKNTSPDPSFIGKKITSMFLYRNRLGFLSEDNVVLSETNEYYNFYYTTMTDVLATDMIDISIDTNNSLKLRYAVSYQEDLVLFGDEEQFVLSSSGPLSTKTMRVAPSTKYSFNYKGKPEVVGPNIYFSVNKDEYSKIREYYIVPDTTTNDAAEISEQVPTYIPKDIVKIKGSTKNDVLFFLSKNNRNNLYVYNYNWSGEEKTQGAWHRWSFKEDLYNIDILDNKLILLFSSSDKNFTIKTIDLDISNNTVSYADHVGTIEGEGDVFALYDSYYHFSTWGFPTTNVNIDDFRRKLKLKNIELSSKYGSYYEIDIYYVGRKNPINNKKVMNDTKRTNKVRAGGWIKDTAMVIHSIQDKGFILNSAIIVGDYKSKSRGV